MNKASLSAGRLICSDAKETVMLLHMMGDIRSIYIILTPGEVSGRECGCVRTE